MATAELAFNAIRSTAASNGNLRSARLPYVVTGAADEDAAITEVLSTAPTAYSGLSRDSASIQERRADDSWLVEAYYKLPGSSTIEGDTKGVTYAFDSTGASQHVEVAIEHVARYGDDATPPDMNCAIGVQGLQPGAQVAGADIVASIYQFSETHYLSQSVVTGEFRRALARKTGMYNNDRFRGYDPCEVLFLGASGRLQGERSTDVWEIDYRFAVSLTRRNFTVGPITVDRKRGWEHMWVLYGDDPSPTSNLFVKKPIGVYIEKVYYGTDFESLGIGTEEI